MYYKIVRFILSSQPTASHFAKPLCRTARYFCRLACKDALSITDLLIIQNIGFRVKILNEKSLKIKNEDLDS